MRPTLLGRLVALAALLLLSLAFVFGTIAPAIAAVVLLAYRDASSRGVQAGKITAERRAPPIVGVDVPFTVEVEAHSEHPLPLSIRDPESRVGSVHTTSTRGRGHATLTRSVVADAPGRLHWEDVVVETRDPWGLWGAEHHVPAPASTRVAPEGHHLQTGRRHGRRNVVQAAVKDIQAASKGADVRLVRPMAPGDHVRDIDWRLTTRMGEMHSRERERQGPRKIMILLDATRSMRRPGRIPKLRSAINVAVGVAGAAQGAGVATSIVAFHETGLYAVSNASSTASLQQIMQGLASLPAVEGVEGFRLTTDIDRSVTKEERTFLHNLAGLSARPIPVAPSLDNALQKLASISTGPSFVVAIMDGEVNPRRAEVAADRLQRMGHHVLVVAPATGPHHCTKQDAPIDDLREAMARREGLRFKLATQKVPMLTLQPNGEDAVIREVSRFAV